MLRLAAARVTAICRTRVVWQVVDAHRAALRVQLAGLRSALAEANSVAPPTYKRPRRTEEGEAGRSGGAAGGIRENLEKHGERA